MMINVVKVLAGVVKLLTLSILADEIDSVMMMIRLMLRSLPSDTCG